MALAITQRKKKKKVKKEKMVKITQAFSYDFIT